MILPERFNEVHNPLAIGPGLCIVH